MQHSSLSICMMPLTTMATATHISKARSFLRKFSICLSYYSLKSLAYVDQGSATDPTRICSTHPLPKAALPPTSVPTMVTRTLCEGHTSTPQFHGATLQRLRRRPYPPHRSTMEYGDSTLTPGRAAAKHRSKARQGGLCCHRSRPTPTTKATPSRRENNASRSYQ